jgi:hypothetical protein
VPRSDCGLERALVIPAPVLVEVAYWVDKWLPPFAIVALLDDIISGAYLIEELKPIDYVRILALCDQYADARAGFVDAAVLAVVERLNEPKLATLDHRHFGMMRPRHVGALRLLPE